jgi:hypothetical protein
VPRYRCDVEVVEQHTDGVRFLDGREVLADEPHCRIIEKHPSRGTPRPGPERAITLGVCGAVFARDVADLRSRPLFQPIGGEVWL